MTLSGGCMSSCKLFETLSKSNITLDAEHQPKCYNCTEECPWFNKCFYNVQCPPEDLKLQHYFCGWQKYAQYDINDKNCKADDNKYIVINILHLINPTKIDDVVIFRVAKKNKDDKTYSIRYMCCQTNKKQLCSDINELNNYLDKKCQYSGRKLVKEDFKCSVASKPTE